MEIANESQVEKGDGIAMYELMGQIGQGAYGDVFKARHRVSGEVFALKKVNYLIDGKVPISVIREKELLETIKHKNIVHMTEFRTTYGESYAFFVLEYCYYDLGKLLQCQTVKFCQAEIKGILNQFFAGLSYLHQQKVIHRDIKPPNILINEEGELKIADFGLARHLGPPPTEDTPGLYTPRVVTLWYRPAEVLLGQRSYGPAVDMWAAGCLMAEMWTREAIIQGKSEPDQLNQIIKLCGPITPDTFPGVESIALFRKLRLPSSKRRVTERLMGCVKDENAINLIEKLLTIDSAARADANTALGHDFFKAVPLSCGLKEMISRFKECVATRSWKARGDSRRNKSNQKL